MASFYGKTPEFDAAMTATIEIFRQLCELEERAGIEVQTMDALRLMGDDTAGENIREKKLQAIRAMRTIYLGVPDVGLRKELIRTVVRWTKRTVLFSRWPRNWMTLAKRTQRSAQIGSMRTKR
jgi:hypothetical protein